MRPTNLVLKKDPSARWMAFYWSALIIVWALYGLQLILTNVDGYQTPYPETTLIIPVILSGVIIGYKWAYRKMAGFQDDIEQLLLSQKDNPQSNDTSDWYVQEFQEVFNWKKSLSTAILFTVAALVIGLRIDVGSWFPTQLTRFLGFLPYLFVGTAFGACVWPGYRMSVFAHNLAKSVPKLNPFVPVSVGIFIIARTFIKFEAVGVSLILLFGTAFELSPYRLSNKLVLVSAVIVSLIWTFWFYFTQSQIHNAMVRYKHQKQLEFAEHYERKLSLLLQNPSREGLEELEKLIVLKKEIESIPVWPFNMRALLTSFGLIVTPLIAALVQRFLAK